MCIIIELPKGVNIPMTALSNAVWNNPHGYGLVVKKSETSLEVIKEITEGGTDPKVIDKLLRKYSKYHRYLHLRWKTEGSLTPDNVHPFTVYDDGKTQVYFMHNGTLYDYKPILPDERSDSRIFAEEFLVPLLVELKGNYTTDLAKKIISKFWGVNGTNKGLIVSNSHAPVYINYSEWKTIKLKDSDDHEVEFRASNDTYFDNLTRGYEYDRREEERKARQSTFSFQGNGTSTQDLPLATLKEIDLRPCQPLTKELQDIFMDSDLYSELGTASLSNLTELEFVTLVTKHPDIASALLFHVTGMYDTLLDDKMEIEEKHDKATKMIASLKKVG